MSPDIARSRIDFISYPSDIPMLKRSERSKLTQASALRPKAVNIVEFM